MSRLLLSRNIRQEGDVVAVRQLARTLAGQLGFESRDQTRIATAVSEIARNAFCYAGSGVAEFALDERDLRQDLVVRVVDHGPGIRDLADVLDGGRGFGLTGARRLMDKVDVQTSDGGGTTVVMRKARPARSGPLAPADARRLAAEIARSDPHPDAMGVLADQNRDLMASLAELRERNEELVQLGRELQDTNRGVVALYAELDEKAEQLRQASELKTRFLSNMSHEFRTPLNSILAISRLLLDRLDGDLSAEQARQVGYIRQSAETLSELVNDLLDLAKVEAGKLDVHVGRFGVEALIGGLRGAMRPLQTSEAVPLIFEDASGLPDLVSDEGKLAQILRNLISNALKYTEAGSVRVSVRHAAATDEMVFTVADTGIGIAPENLDRIFDEFVQLENGIQGRAKGTGLGLPLSRRLAQLLRGRIDVESGVGRGSVFTLSIPVNFVASPAAGRDAVRVLVVDDDASFRYVVRQILGSAPGFELAEAVNGAEALERARAWTPDVIVLDVHMPVLDGVGVMRALRAEPETAAIPVVVLTSHTIDAGLRAAFEGSRALLSKDALSRDALLPLLAPAATKGRP
ncbi:ATP-binding protein [Alsobacter sp. SYSU M60028]|uniref:histidine kinase n=1 Tax=Alsobacter ponti TaxID=2962936 RepID=A0ABT1L8W3_9HYPH|nr:ATP-binding protein [Alsobacter ponti]MCP8937526.1 ATP-binding protein [Alsobacter ponti]